MAEDTADRRAWMAMLVSEADPRRLLSAFLDRLMPWRWMLEGAAGDDVTVDEFVRAAAVALVLDPADLRLGVLNDLAPALVRIHLCAPEAVGAAAVATVRMIDDAAEALWQRVSGAGSGMGEEERETLWDLRAASLHLKVNLAISELSAADVIRDLPAFVALVCQSHDLGLAATLVPDLMTLNERFGVSGFRKAALKAIHTAVGECLLAPSPHARTVELIACVLYLDLVFGLVREQPGARPYLQRPHVAGIREFLGGHLVLQNLQEVHEVAALVRLDPESVFTAAGSPGLMFLPSELLGPEANYFTDVVPLILERGIVWSDAGASLGPARPQAPENHL